MRLRLLRNIRMAGIPSVELLAGSIVEVSHNVADKWLREGVAMEDKSIDAPKTTKARKGGVKTNGSND